MCNQDVISPPASGEQTAERKETFTTGNKFFHTVTTSNPTEERLVRIRPRQSSIPDAPLSWIAKRHIVNIQQRSLNLDMDTKTYTNNNKKTRINQDFPCRNETQVAGERSFRSNDATQVSVLSGNAPSFVWSASDHTREMKSNNQDDVLSRVATLKALCDEGYITKTEYERRKCVVMDELTFASLPTSASATYVYHPRRPVKRTDGLPRIVPHAPDFRNLIPEVAIKHIFSYETRQWTSMQVYVTLDETAFSKGSLRVVYHLQDLNDGTTTGSYVAKVAIDPDEDPQTYFRDVELQAHCAHYAQLYNDYLPPKRVEFLKAWVLELTERDATLCAVEEYIPGEYRKHNNNYGCVSEDERNTPQSFSHFTFEASKHELLAVDIQGVGDKYTDPQIHTLKGTDFGKGNLGVFGFQKFLSSHQCNSICRYLKLPPVNPKDRHTDHGTLPLQELMNRDRIRATRFESTHYYEQAPMLQKYIAQCREFEEKDRKMSEENELNGWCNQWMFCGCQIQ